MILPRRVLFVGAHCDDIELFSGGLLARLCYAKASVGVLTFSDHRGVVDEDTAQRASAERLENLRWLEERTGAKVIDHSGAMLPACRGHFERERAALYAAMEHLRDDYDLVVTHSAADTNQDHRQVADEAARVFKAHATVLAGEFPNNDLGGFHAEVFVALDEREISDKIELVGRYRSQQFGGRPYLDGDTLIALARVRGAQIRAPFAEAFAVGARVVLRG